ncbi:hypothetical protein FRB90_004671 [Tulasnella sp. 427]|nr:hypothetical protein FRB90_004671 [Tulasnella sp. 427]
MYTTSLGTPAISSPGSSSTVEPVTETVAVHKGYKIFLNICWDPQVPPPPERDDDEIRKAMMGADLDSGIYFIPVIISDGKMTTDKAGKPSLVFDCVFNMKLRSRATKDYDFRTFLTEIALERVEDRSGLTLSREIATPNIPSKGTLLPRTVSIPTALPAPKPLIQEIPSSEAPLTPVNTAPKGILKPSAPKVVSATAGSTAKTREQPKWSAEIDNTGIVIVIITPKLSKSLFGAPQTSPTLDIEPHRVIFIAPNGYELDLRLNAVTGKLVAVKGRLEEDVAIGKEGDTSGKGIDPDGAIAEWRVDKGIIVVKVPWKK